MAFTRLSISLLLSGLILSAGMPAQAAPETVMVPEVTAMALEGKWPADWSYQGDDGPDHWGELHPSYSKCARGRVQSPVDLGKATMRSRRSTVRVAFHPIRYEIFNDGRGIHAVPLEPQHPIRIDRHDYTLKHIVFRAPSEHTFQGRHYPLEAQLVYEADDGALAVLATVFTPGHSNPSLAALTRQPLAEGQRRVLDKPLGTRVLLPRRGGQLGRLHPARAGHPGADRRHDPPDRPSQQPPGTACPSAPDGRRDALSRQPPPCAVRPASVFP